MAVRCRATTGEGPRDWLRRKIEAGALLRLPTYQPPGDRLGRRPEKYARALLAVLDDPRSAPEAEAEVRAFRAWVGSHPPPSRPAARCGPVASPEIRLALKMIAHPSPIPIDGAPFSPPRPRSPRVRSAREMVQYLLAVFGGLLLWAAAWDAVARRGRIGADGTQMGLLLGASMVALLAAHASGRRSPLGRARQRGKPIRPFAVGVSDRWLDG